MDMKQYEFWFLTGTQPLYGQEAIDAVNEHARVVAQGLDQSEYIPCRIVCKTAVKDSRSITETIQKANLDKNCAGVITWMHTFSPSKMWIPGLTKLQKPLLHFNTQFNRDIPFESIDMDFMNLNQSAHGDREHGYIGARLRLPRKVICGYWADAGTQKRIGHWMRSAIGAFESRRTAVCRFGDNMRGVAVTEGDKVEAEIRLGWSVNGYGIGDLIAYADAADETEIEAKMTEYRERYSVDTDDLDAVRYQARLEVAMRRFLAERACTAFTDTFEDLQQLRQLPGLAVQNMMKDGFGFGAEGDWKTAALCSVMKRMAAGLPGGTAFMEDYTYHMEPGREAVLGAHMLEVDPDIACDKPGIQVFPLGIGDREPPARLTFQTGEGKAIVASLIDMGDRFRMIVNDVAACEPYEDMPKLPVARVMWKPLPDLLTSAECWILAGGAHHTVLSYQLDAEHIRDFCTIMGIEYIHIGAETKPESFERELLYSEKIWGK